MNNTPRCLKTFANSFEAVGGFFIKEQGNMLLIVNFTDNFV